MDLVVSIVAYGYQQLSHFVMVTNGLLPTQTTDSSALSTFAATLRLDINRLSATTKDLATKYSNVDIRN